MDKAERKSMIKVRGGFSEDMGFNPCNTHRRLLNLIIEPAHSSVINFTIFFKLHLNTKPRCVTSTMAHLIKTFLPFSARI